MQHELFSPDSQIFLGGLLTAETENVLVDLSPWSVGNTVQPLGSETWRKCGELEKCNEDECVKFERTFNC